MASENVMTLLFILLILGYIAMAICLVGFIRACYRVKRAALALRKREAHCGK